MSIISRMVMAAFIGCFVPNFAHADEKTTTTPPAPTQQGELVGVLCAWDLYLMAKAAIIECMPKEKALIGSIDTAIGRMNEFIIYNTPKKLAEGETTRATAERLEFYSSKIKQDKATQADLCKNMRTDPVVDIMYRMGPKGIKSDMDTLLSVARVPSQDPCW